MSEKEILYLECYSGISGDMTVAALLDLGADQKVLMDVLHSLPLSGYHVEISRVMKSGIDACDFNVILDEEHDNHDHDMEYLYGHSNDFQKESHQHNKDLEAENHQQNEGLEAEKHQHDEDLKGYNHEHFHEHTHKNGHHHHIHRGMKEICDIIEKCEMTTEAKSIAVKIFTILAEAESKAHNVPIEQVHFHEVGAVDSIVDIIATAVCLDNLGVKDVVVTELRDGTGTVRCQHGILPVPVPAVLNIIQANHLNLQIMNWKGEFVTPTGAAIVAAVKTEDELPKRFRVKKIGIGAGKRVYDGPGMLRAMLIEKNI